MKGYLGYIPIRKRGKLTGKFAKVDISDFVVLNEFNWGLSVNGYVYRDVNGVRIYMHRLILDGNEIDHINRDKLDNRKENLRSVTHQQNMQNASRTRGNYTSKYRGVSWSKERSKWVAKATLNGKQFPLGRYDSEAEANEVVVAWRRDHMEYSGE